MDQKFYAIYYPDKSSFASELEDLAFLSDYKMTPSMPVVPFWLILQVVQNNLEVFIEIHFHLPYYRSTKNFNNEIILKKLSQFLDNVTYRANTIILLQDLKETLECPDNLKFYMKKEKETPITSTPSEIATKELPKPSLARKRFAKPKPQGTIILKKEDVSFLPPLSIKNYEVPIVYRKYFSMFGGLSLKHLLSNFSFNNFRVSNRKGMYVGLYKDEVYILSFEEQTKEKIMCSELYKSFEQLDEEMIKPDNSNKVIIVMDIYSMYLNQQAIDYFVKHIMSEKINQDIKVICVSLIKQDKIRLTKEDCEFLLETPFKKVYHFIVTILKLNSNYFFKILRYSIPDCIKSIPSFLVYFRQNLLKVFSNFTFGNLLISLF